MKSRLAATAIASLLAATSLASIQTYPMPLYTEVTSITGDAAGNVWYADGTTRIVRRSPDGTFTTINSPCSTLSLAADADSNLYATCDIPPWGVELIRPDGAISPIFNFPPAAFGKSLDGSVLIGRSVAQGTEIFRARGGSLGSVGVANVGDVSGVSGDADGTIWLSGSKAIAHISGGDVQLYPSTGGWIAFAGGQPWTPLGPLFGERRDDLVSAWWSANDAESGTFWVTTDFNAALRVHPDGRVDQIQLPGNIEEGASPIAIAGDFVWTAKRGLLIAIGREDTPPALHWERGELVSQDLVGNCCFEGTHAAYRVYPLPASSIVRVLDYRYPPIGVGRNRDWYAAADGNSALRKDGAGRTLARYEMPEGAWLALPRYDGNVFILGSNVETLTFAEFNSDGTLLARTSAPRTDFYGLSADLSSDQCTIFYTNTQTSISRKNACEDSAPQLVLSTNEPIKEIRLLARDELLVATPSAVARYASDGTLIKEYVVHRDDGRVLRTLVLDVDGVSFWTANNTFEKVDIETGEIVDAPGSTTSSQRLFMIGEPRQALFPNGLRRRGVRH